MAKQDENWQNHYVSIHVAFECADAGYFDGRGQSADVHMFLVVVVCFPMIVG